MESKKSLITIIREDATALFGRIKDRKNEYLTVFALKRERSHFHDIFRTNFHNLNPGDLKEVGENAIRLIYNFYNTSDEIYWYLKTTQDLPQSIEDYLGRSIRDLKQKLDELDGALEEEYLQISSDSVSSHDIVAEEDELPPPDLPKF